MQKSIKIIKQSQRRPSEPTAQTSHELTKTENQVRREIAQTVTGWIEERRILESCTRTALNFFLPPEQSVPER